MDEKTWTNGINEASKMALLAWEKETGIELVQINGQRRYGGPPPGLMFHPSLVSANQQCLLNYGFSRKLGLAVSSGMTLYIKGGVGWKCIDHPLLVPYAIPGACT